MNRELRQMRPIAKKFYRDCMRVVLQLKGDHKFVWKDYVRLKYNENLQLRDSNRIKQLLEDGQEQLEWVKKLLLLKKSSVTKTNMG